MDLKGLKSGYSNVGNAEISKENLQRMISGIHHPVLRGVKIQLIFETVIWVSFLMVYYDFFDGHNKPLLWNGLLILSVFFIMVHNLLGHRIINNPVNGPNLQLSLKNYLMRIRKYSIVSIITRVFAISMLFGFFVSGIATFETRHYWTIIMVILLIFLQIFLLWGVWSKRINKITTVYEQLKGS